MAAMFFQDQDEMRIFFTGPHKYHSCKDWFQLDEQFQYVEMKYQKVKY
jgi:hypothetical protein